MPEKDPEKDGFIIDDRNRADPNEDEMERLIRSAERRSKNRALAVTQKEEKRQPSKGGDADLLKNPKQS